MDNKSPLICLIGSAGCLLIALHGKQSPTGAMAASLGGVILAQTAMNKASERFIDDEVNVILRNAEISKFELAAQAELAALLPEEAQAEIIDVQATETIPENTDKYNWEQIVDENCLLIGGEPGSAKTSVAAGYIVPKISQAYSSEIIVLDSHAKKNDWQGMGYHRVINDYEQIYECLLWLDEERERRRNSEENHHLIICIFDEINDMWSYLERYDKQNKTKRLSNAQLILQTLLNCRKFDILIIGMMQSHLCEDIGLSGAIRRQAMILLLNGAAREEAGRNKKKLTHQQYNYLTDKKRPYCCLITGYQTMQIADHPTHGHYTTFAKKGKTPENVSKPKNWNIVTIPFAKNYISNVEQNNDSNGNNIIHTETGIFDLNKEGVRDEDEGEDESETSPTPHPKAQELEDILSKGCSDLSPLALIPDNWSPVSPKVDSLGAEVRGVMVSLININTPKEETIKLVFGCSKSGKSKSWKAASYWYDEVKSQIS
ncbi:hypothetical protein [Okeania sp. SIO1I7]|uniref:hypothetical protein n=1 Tax=Okeania sp. SIO1I7 TaxID=2607772 RepID=UPI0013F79067|nr:hypothetical protein [Okeania sp. SIO1I7]NET30228.1 hypothetical protein [Okeania sp. SIO1I7]